MSRSKKKDIIKDKPRNYKKTTAYWRPVRRIQKHSIAKVPVNIDITHLCVDNDLEDQLNIDIPHNRQLMNDYDYSDYKFVNCGIKYTRK